MIIEDGTGNSYKAKVNINHELVVKAITEHESAHIAEEFGESYVAIATDIGPVAGEYTLYFKNTSEKDFIVSEIRYYVTDADVEWIFTTVTGTASGAAVIEPVNTNLGSGHTADAVVRGGAGGVTGLTPVKTIIIIKGGIALSNVVLITHLVIPKNIAVAFEYNAGTGGVAQIGIFGYYKQD